VLSQARASLTTIEGAPAAAAEPAPLRRFEFVHNAPLRPVLAQAFADSGRQLEQGDHVSAFITCCGILETLITDALESKGLDVSSWSFDTRIEAAQHKNLIGSGCVRLPSAARRYRDVWDEEGRAEDGAAISPRDAKLVRQVLLVIMRDLDPGR
jgi:hypothetical protein